MNNEKRILGMIVIFTACFNIVTMSNVQALTATEFAKKLASLQTTYYHGMEQSNSEEGSTCFGYAYMIAKNIFGSSAKVFILHCWF